MSDSDVVAVSRRDLELLVRAADALNLKDLEYGVVTDTLEACGIGVTRDATDEDRERLFDDEIETIVELSPEIAAAVARCAPLVGYEPEVVPDEDDAFDGASGADTAPAPVAPDAGGHPKAQA